MTAGTSSATRRVTCRSTRDRSRTWSMEKLTSTPKTDTEAVSAMTVHAALRVRQKVRAGSAR